MIAARFLEEYAEDPLELAEVTFLLPNRRACQSLVEAFVRAQGNKPTLLPQMLPLGEVEEDELLLSGAAAEALAELPPAVGRAERLMLFTRIILAKPKDFGLEKMTLRQACFLAQELAGLIDTVYNEELDFAALTRLVPEDYAAHWQETLKFLEIITAYWPQILGERERIDASERKRRLILAQSAFWRAHPPQKRIIAAGTTATYPAMRQLAQTIVSLPRGEIILPGLDRGLNEEAWQQIDETHPQFELKQLLEYLAVERDEVVDLLPPARPEREKLITELMRPAADSDRWRQLAKSGLPAAAWAGLTVINTADIREEALAIALIMRQTLETPSKTAALVTPDRNLARRVAAELERWQIKVDDSAGRPLSLTPAGSFLRLLLAAARPDWRRVDLLSLLKHPLCGLGGRYAEVRRQARLLEQKVWRGQLADEDLESWAQKAREKLRALREVLEQPSAPLKEILQRHLAAAEAVAASDEKSGAELLWRGEDGAAAAEFLAEWLEQAGVLGEVNPFEYAGLFESMLGQVTVRPRFGTHPRLKILGPIEARLNHFDTLIIGEVNEGIWPAAAGADPWMSRPMKREFGLPLPEKAIGILGLDFCNLLGAGEVYLTRAERVEGTPMVKSRWLMRLETVLKAAGTDMARIEDTVFRLLAKTLDRPEESRRIVPPAPCPPVSARPRQLSASGIEMLMRDPYAVYAKYILRLKKLGEIEPELNMADYGVIIHGILEKFNNKYPTAFPANAEEELLALGRESFAANRLALERRAFWWPAFEKIVRRLVRVEQDYRQQIKKVHNELSGCYSFEAPAGPFTITAKADRVDETLAGRLNIIDYKTGRIRTEKEVRAGKAPQLPIEGLIAEKGGFGVLPAKEVEQLIYWQLGRKEAAIAGEMDELLARTEQQIKELIALFDFESTPYLPHPNPAFQLEHNDYERLARLREWSVTGSDEEGTA